MGSLVDAESKDASEGFFALSAFKPSRILGLFFNEGSRFSDFGVPLHEELLK